MSLLTQKTQARLATVTSVVGCSRNTMVDPAGMARGLRPASSGYAPWITATQICLLIAILVMAGGIMVWCGPAQGADQVPAAPTLPPGSTLTFDEAVKIAINQSPSFTKSSLDIDIRQMDETDSRYAMVPPLTFSTVYYVNRFSGENHGPPYSLNFSTQPYSPLGAYFTLQAQKQITQVAIFSHLSIISGGLEKLGALYLQLDALHKLAGNRSNQVKIAQENLTYMENRVANGTGTSLEVKVAQQELQLARGEAEGIALSIKRTVASLKNFLGLASNQDITPVFQDSQRQVLGNFNPATVTLEEAKSRSYDLKTLEIYKKLQAYHISLAKAKIFPTITFNSQTPDPLSGFNAHGMYVGFGLQVPVWDGFSRIRDVSRQKAILKQAESRKEMRANLLEDKWFSVLQDIHDKQVALKNTQSLEELARLKTNQNEVRYQSGEVPLTVVLESRKEILKVQDEAVRRGLDYDKAVLKFREISGDLGNTYVDPNSWKK